MTAKKTTPGQTGNAPVNQDEQKSDNASSQKVAITPAEKPVKKNGGSSSHKKASTAAKPEKLKLPAFKRNRAITEISDLLELTSPKGVKVKGYCQRYTTDVNAPHFTAKKGDVIWFDEHNVLLDTPESFTNL